MKLVILDTSQRVFDQVWKPFQEGVSKLQSPIDLGELLESIAGKISRGVSTQYDLGKNYVDQDADMFIGELFNALPGKKPQDKLVTLKKIVCDDHFARVSWGAKDLFEDLTPGEDQLILYPSNIEPFLANEELFNFKANITMPGSIVVSSDLDLVSGYPGKMTLSFNTMQQTAAPVSVSEAEAYFFSGGTQPTCTAATEEHLLTKAVSNTKVYKQERLAQVDEAMFVKRFCEHYNPGVLGGHWGRFFARPIMNESTIRAYARRRPGSATAKAVEMVNKKLKVS